MNKGFLINSVNKTITEVQVGDYKDIQSKIGCRCFDVVSIDDDNDVYVDDEGLLSIDDNSKFFGFKGHDIRLCGNGVVLGINQKTGDSKDCTITKEWLNENIVFFELNDCIPYLERVGIF